MKNIEKVLQSIKDNAKEMELCEVSCSILFTILTGKNCDEFKSCKDCPMNTVGSMLKYLNDEEQIKLTQFEYDILCYYADMPAYDNFMFCGSYMLEYLKRNGWFDGVNTNMLIKDIVKKAKIVRSK